MTRKKNKKKTIWQKRVNADQNTNISFRMYPPVDSLVTLGLTVVTSNRELDTIP